jgi:hypothetical protein
MKTNINTDRKSLVPNFYKIKYFQYMKVLIAIFKGGIGEIYCIFNMI